MDQQACILVVDDDADIVNAVRLYLEKEGFCVYGAADGFEALDDRLVQIFLQGPRSYSALMNREIEVVPEYQYFLSTVYYHARVLCADGLVTPSGEALAPQAVAQQKLLSRQALEQLQQSEEYTSRDILLYLSAEGEETISSSLLRSPDEIPQGYEIVFQLKDGSIGGNSLLLDVCNQMSYLVSGTAFSSTQEILVEDIPPPGWNRRAFCPMRSW